METFLAFARGFSFREKAQRYHNRILSNVRRQKSALARPPKRHKKRARHSMEGLAPIC